MCCWDRQFRGGLLISRLLDDRRGGSCLAAHFCRKCSAVCARWQLCESLAPTPPPTQSLHETRFPLSGHFLLSLPEGFLFPALSPNRSTWHLDDFLEREGALQRSYHVPGCFSSMWIQDTLNLGQTRIRQHNPASSTYGAW